MPTDHEMDRLHRIDFATADLEVGRAVRDIAAIVRARLMAVESRLDRLEGPAPTPTDRDEIAELRATLDRTLATLDEERRQHAQASDAYREQLRVVTAERDRARAMLGEATAECGRVREAFASLVRERDRAAVLLRDADEMCMARDAMRDHMVKIAKRVGASCEVGDGGIVEGWRIVGGRILDAIDRLLAEHASLSAEPAARPEVLTVERLAEALDDDAVNEAVMHRMGELSGACGDSRWDMAGAILAALGPVAATPAPLTVGEALRSPYVVEWRHWWNGKPQRWWQARVGTKESRMLGDDGKWRDWQVYSVSFAAHEHLPARLVPLAEADADPSARGPIGGAK